MTYRHPISVRVLLAIVLLIISMNACGGTTTSTQDRARSATASDDMGPLAWAAAVCTSIGRWDDALVPLRFAAGEDDLTSTRDSLVGALDNALAATTTMLNEIRAAGAPSVAGGDAAAQEMRRALQPIPDIIRRAARDARALPVDDPFAFDTARDALARRVAEEIGATLALLSEVATSPATDLDEAFATLPACVPTG